ncbi:hypothetical protein BKA64DRAFT_710036 [Cadophora sp. MPI-SDFR-AT-0126]|nr:hypothetical protein BKA64DRAFT_710036 [Leotiomycetes sp. MPI-SDFR-AT-0126]
MATKPILAANTISALKEQARKFSAMTVHLAKSADLATNQAAEIAKWTSTLINVMTKIQRDTQRDAVACQERVRGKIRSLETQAYSRKRKILDTAELASRTAKTNFRLIFGPPRKTEYPSKSTQYVMVIKSNRINTIRGLSESHPDGVIAFSMTCPTKVWTESSLEVFEGLTKSIKDEKEQNWPGEIVDIMNELEAERPMSIEFSNLRAKISLRQARRRRRLGEIGGPAREIAPLPPAEAGELATRTLSAQYPSGMTQLPSLQQMALIAPSFNRDQTQGWGSRQDLNTDSGYTFIDGQRHQPIHCRSVHYPSRQNEQENPIADDSLPPSKEKREMKDMYTNAPASNISKMPEPFRTAIENSRLWKWERRQGLETTGCWPSLFPKDQTQDVSFTIWCGNKDGERLTDIFGGNVEMSS